MASWEYPCFSTLWFKNYIILRVSWSFGTWLVTKDSMIEGGRLDGSFIFCSKYHVPICGPWNMKVFGIFLCKCLRIMLYEYWKALNLLLYLGFHPHLIFLTTQYLMSLLSLYFWLSFNDLQGIFKCLIFRRSRYIKFLKLAHLWRVGKNTNIRPGSW
jgi:hypothetical protein